MTKLLLSLAFAVVAYTAQAEEKTCTVKGMHCTGCTEMVEGKVCDEAKFSECKVKITDAKKEMGEIHLVTKEASAKIDEKAVGAAVTDAGYKLQKCKATGAAKPDVKKTKG